MEKQTEKAIRILIYIIITIIALSLATSLIFPIAIATIIKGIGEKIQKTPQSSISRQIETPRRIVTRIEKKKEKQETKKKEENFKGVIYSWKNEKGERCFSNIGFPKNEKYTDPIIEWN